MAGDTNKLRKRDKVLAVLSRGLSNGAAGRPTVERSSSRSANCPPAPRPSDAEAHSSSGECCDVLQRSSSPNEASRVLRPAAHNLWSVALGELPEEEQKLLEKHGTSTLSGFPMVDSLLDVAREKSRQCQSKRWEFTCNGRRYIVRDVAERIVAWLDKLKQIGDVAVNADPLHAGLPWAAIRFLLQVAVSDSAQLGALLAGLEKMLYLMNRCKIYERMYIAPCNEATDEVHNLIAALTSLYAAILKLLARTIDLCERSTTGRILHALWQPDHIPELERRLDGLEKRVDIEASNCDRLQGTISRSQEAENFRAQLQQLQSLQMSFTLADDRITHLWQRSQASDRTEILVWLSRLPYQDYHNMASKERTPGTAEWILRRTEFKTWESLNQSAILWLHGIPGAGKTKLTSKVVDHFRNQADEITIAYFYCDRNDERRREPDSILRSFIKQLSISSDGERLEEPLVRTYDDIKRRGFHTDRLNETDANGLLVQLIHRSPRAVLILDALDECPEQVRETIMETFFFLIESSERVKIFISSRRDGDITYRLKNEFQIGVEETDNESDIGSFISDKIEQDGKKRRKPIREELRKDIIRILNEQSRGMFQWASLQVRQLLNLERESDMIERLGKLPKGLIAAYNEIFNQILTQEGSFPEIAERAFQWVMAAIYGCSEGLLTAAMCQDPDKDGIQPVDINRDDILSACKNLLIFDEELREFHFVHLSVREYLETERYPGKRADTMLAKVCLVLLNDYSHPASREVRKEDDVSIGDLEAGEYFRDSSNSYRRRCSCELGQRDDVESYSHLKEDNSSLGIYGSFASLRKSNGLASISDLWKPKSDSFDHASSSDGDRRVNLNLSNDQRNGQGDEENKRSSGRTAPLSIADSSSWKSFNSGNTRSRCDGHHHTYGAPKHRSSIMYAIGFWTLHIRKIGDTIGDDRLCSLLKRFLGSFLESSTAYRVWYRHKSSGGHFRLQPSLLVDCNGDLRPASLSLLSVCTYGLYEILADWWETTELPDVNLRTKYGRRPLLTLATIGGSKGMVKNLIDRGAEVNASGGPNGGALTTAAMHGYKDMTRLLLDAGADSGMDATENDICRYGPALHAAASRGHDDIVRMLVQEGAIVNQTSINSWNSPLAAAAQGGWRSTTHLLLELGADVNLGLPLSGGCGSALAAAASSGNDYVVSVLIDHGAQLNTPLSGRWGSALIAAVAQAKSSTARLLLERGAEVDFPLCESQGSALATAAHFGYTDIMRLLIDAGADFNLPLSGKHGSALIAAAAAGNIGTTRLLLEHGADVNLSLPTRYGTPLIAAVYSCKEDVVRLLLASGARVDTRPVCAFGNALDAAAGPGSARTVKLLLEYGADVNLPLRTDFGSALSRAVATSSWSGGPESILLLLEAGADPNARLCGRYGTALITAAFLGQVEAARLLLRAGADVNAYVGGAYGTALTAAVRCTLAPKSRRELVQLLLDNGADVNAPGGDDYKSALAAARGVPSRELEQILLSAGAKDEL